MAAFDYTATAATVTRLMARFGAAAVLKRQAVGDYDADNGAALVTPVELSTTAAVFDYPARFVDGTLILQGDRQAYLVPAQTPVQGDVLEWSASDFRIIAVKPIAPAGTVVMFECQIRGAGAAAADVEVIIDGGGDA